MTRREDCEAVVRQLWPYLDGYLADENREAIIRHLEGCATCQSHFDFAAEFLAAVALSDPPVGMDVSALERRVIAALAAEH